MPIVKCTIHLDRSPDDFVSKLIYPVHLCALGGLSRPGPLAIYGSDPQLLYDVPSLLHLHRGTIPKKGRDREQHTSPLGHPVHVASSLVPRVTRTVTC